MLIKENPDLVFSEDANGCTTLFLAAIYNHKDVAELLLANKADVECQEQGWTDTFAFGGAHGHGKNWW